MTPQERQLVADLFDRLASLERNRRDPDAEATIAEGLRRAPNALYALVQTVLVQDEALRAADARIRELEDGGQSQQGGFLDSMRDTFLGRRDDARGSVPSVRGNGARPGAAAPWQGAANAQPQQPAQGGSFLGTAAAAAAGVIGGSLLLDSIRSMTGGGGAHAAMNPSSGGAEKNSPWGDASGSDLARDAGVNDMGGDERASLADTAANDSRDDDFSGEDSGDFDADFGGDSDFG